MVQIELLLSIKWLIQYFSMAHNYLPYKPIFIIESLSCYDYSRGLLVSRYLSGNLIVFYF